MSNPLSPLSPSGQNTRSPFPTTTSAKSDAFKPSESPTSHKDSMAPSRIYNDDYERENTSDTTTQNPTHWSPRDTLGQDEDDNGDNEIYDDCMEEPVQQNDDDEEEGPPSSPFQNSVALSDRTTTSICAGGYRDFTPKGNEVGGQITAESVPTNEGADKGDDDMVMDERPPQQHEESEESLLRNADVGNDVMYGCEDHEVGTDTYNNIPPQERSQGMGQRKISGMTNMTFENEGMSAVEESSNSPKAISAEQNDMHGSGNETGNSGNNTSFDDTGDDTRLSTLSAIRNADMGSLSKLGPDSPAKRLRETLSPKKGAARPSILRESLAQTTRSPRNYQGANAGSDDANQSNGDGSPTGSPTPKRKYSRIRDSVNLLEFTDQFNIHSQRQEGGNDDSASPSRRATRRSPSKRSPTRPDLLDFDISPAPTPRSIPTITPRELESLKSSLLSEISSLKATLSGRDAEVSSLKQAVADAERRVGEALEDVGNEAAKKEELESEQREWERRGKEMESVLKGVKSEIVDGERERERLAKKVDESEKSKEQLEGRVVELESQLSASRESGGSAPGTNSQSTSSQDSNNDLKSARDNTAKEVQDAVEKVARELHALYKSKHETKVTALKKSYEARWEKRVRELENKLQESLQEVERLKTERETPMPGATPAGETTILRESEELEAQKRVLEARVKGLEEEMLALKRDSEVLRTELKTERAEKGELVAVVDEWLNMQQEQTDDVQDEPPPQQMRMRTDRIPSLEPPTTTPPGEKAEDDVPAKKQGASDGSGKENIGFSSGAPAESAVSGIPGAPSSHPQSGNPPRSRVAPGTTHKVPRFGMPSNHSRGNSASEKQMGSGIARIPAPQRSGIMSSIEKMGRGGG